jgi:ureidoglycolate lyase/seryl-tRNA synthetase
MGLYIHPGVWHNAVYVKPEHAPTDIFGRQGKVHARISVRWTEEFNKVLRVPLSLPL